MTKLSWIRCSGNQWCPLNTVNLDSPHFDGMEGVYVIWHGGQTPATVRVGRGMIRDRLRGHRSDREIQQYAAQGLFVTWAEVGPSDRDGVEAYLFSRLAPLVGERGPQCSPVPVDLPW